MHASDWIAISSTITAVIAVILSYFSYRRTQDIRRQEIHDSRRSQARLITAWWTRVDEHNQDALAGEAESTVWPEETGYRVWANNSSDDAVYECSVYADVQLTEKGMAELKGKGFTGKPYIIIFKEQLIIGVGTLPPKERLPFGLDRSLIRSVGKLTIEFRDANGVDWRRTAGTLEERPSDGGTDPTRRLDPGSGSSSRQYSGEATQAVDPPELPN
jgi:hypothetical protein